MFHHSTHHPPLHPSSITPPVIHHSTHHPPLHPSSITPPVIHHSTRHPPLHPSSTTPPVIHHSTRHPPLHPSSTTPPIIHHSTLHPHSTPHPPPFISHPLTTCHPPSTILQYLFHCRIFVDGPFGTASEVRCSGVKCPTNIHARHTLCTVCDCIFSCTAAGCVQLRSWCPGRSWYWHHTLCLRPQVNLVRSHCKYTDWQIDRDEHVHNQSVNQ